VHYFSDGVSSQYKKCKTFLNLKYEDFYIAAEWNFLHGKICWDGICQVKRLVAHASLYETERIQILTPKDVKVNGPKEILQELHSST
jgi:hypothetical protein